jgi:Tol biopolymer transport system component
VDLFVWDRQAGTTELVSVGLNGSPASYPEYGFSGSPAISGDGRFVAFWSDATNLAPGDSNRYGGVFVRDRQSGRTERVSEGTIDFRPAISSDGRFVAFGDGDIYVRDRQTGTTELVSVTPVGDRVNGWCVFPAISGDGRFVAFASAADNLVPEDTNGRTDVFVAERG